MLLLAGSIALLPAQSENAGSTGFATLRHNYQARSSAMGEAFNSIPANAEGLFFNPSVILQSPGKSVSSSLASYFVGSGGGSVQYVHPVDDKMAFGGGIKYWNSGLMDRTEISASNEYVDTGETFGAHSFILYGSMAHYINDGIDIGATLKMISDSIDDKSASAVALDFGLLHHTANEKIKVGLSIRNLGLQTSYYTEAKHKEGLPLIYSAGISMQANEKLLGSFELEKASSESVRARIGAEYLPLSVLALRAGLRTDFGDYNMGGNMGFLGGFSMGVGYTLSKLQLDYAVVSLGDLGLSNRLSLGYKF